MNHLNAISHYPEIQDGAPVFSGTRIRVETLVDYMRIGVSLNEFLDEFPSVSRDQVVDVLETLQQQNTHSSFQQVAAA